MKKTFLLICLLLTSAQVYSSIFLTDEKGFTVEISNNLKSYLRNLKEGGRIVGLRDAQLVKNFLENTQDKKFGFHEKYSLNQKITLLHDLILLDYNSRYSKNPQPYDTVFILTSILREILENRDIDFNADDIADSLEKMLQNRSQRYENLLGLFNVFHPKFSDFEGNIDNRESMFELIVDEENKSAEVIYTKNGISNMLITFPILPRKRFELKNHILNASGQFINLHDFLYIAENITGGIDFKNRTLDKAILKKPGTYSEDIGNLFNQDIK